MHALALGAAVARVQRRQLDRDARAFVDAAPGRGLADRVDRLLVGGEVALRRRARSSPPRRACRRSSGSPRPRACCALASASAMVSPVTNCSPIRRIAMSTPLRISGSPLRADDAAQRGAQARFAVRGDQLAGEQQAPGGGVDEQRRAVRRDARASRRCRSCRGSARRAWPRRGCAAAPRPGTSAPRLPASDSENSCSSPCTRPARPADALALAQRLRQPPRQRLRGRAAARRSRRACASSAGSSFGLGATVGRGDGVAQRRARQAWREGGDGHGVVGSRRIHDSMPGVKPAGRSPRRRQLVLRPGVEVAGVVAFVQLAATARPRCG